MLGTRCCCFRLSARRCGLSRPRPQQPCSRLSSPQRKTGASGVGRGPPLRWRHRGRGWFGGWGSLASPPPQRPTAQGGGTAEERVGGSPADEQLRKRDDRARRGPHGFQAVFPRRAAGRHRQEERTPIVRPGGAVRKKTAAQGCRPLARGRPSAEQVVADPQTDMLASGDTSAICVQRLDDSRSLQFAPRIAVRCVLHRCESLEIHC